MTDRRALVITSPGIMSLQEAAELIPGHEWSGIIEDVGPGVTGPRGKVILEVNKP